MVLAESPPRPPGHLRRWHRVVLALAAAVYVCVVAYLVLWPTAVTPVRSVTILSRLLEHVGFSYNRTHRAVVEFGSNIALTFPAPILFAVWVRWSWLRWTLVGLVGSSCVELYQLLALPNGRSATVRDVVANTSGMALGALVALGARRVLGARHPAPMMRRDDDGQRGG